MPGRRIGTPVAVLLGVILVAALIGVLRATPPALPSAAATPVPPDQGTAHSTFVGNAGFAVAVTQVERDAHIPAAPDPGAGLHYLAVRVQFRNSSAQQQRADPRDFQLVDATGASRPPTFLAASSGCARWRMADLYPNGPGSARPRDPEAVQAGRTFGPVPLCFAAAGDPNGSLTLVWDPDVALPLFDTPTRITLQ